MSALKRFEIGVRKIVLQALGRLIRRKNELPPNVDFNRSKFLFIRQDRIGDVLVSTPLFALLKKHYPNAVIDVLLSKNNYFVLEHEPLVRKRWMYTKRPVSSLKTLAGIRAERYDFVIDLMDNPSATSTVIALVANGVWNVGLDKENRYAYDIVVPLLSRKETHIVERLAQLLTVFGIQPEQEDLQVRFSTSGRSRETIDRFLQSLPGDTKNVIGVNISAGSDTRYWGTESYQELLRRIRDRYSYPILVLFKPSDRPRAVEIAKAVPNSTLAPEMDFDHFAEMIRRLYVLITPDTSAVHLASAFSVPSVVLYVQSDANLRIWEPYKTPCEPVITNVDDLKTIPVDRVFEALQRLLVTAGRPGTGAARALGEPI